MTQYLDTAMDTDRLSANARAFSVAALIGENTGCQRPEEGVKVELLSRELWNQFFAIGTEMIITKSGRRMFPSIKIRISGLEDHLHYVVYLDMDPVDDKRYKYIYQSSKWVPCSGGDIPHEQRRFFHPDGPRSGDFWNRQSCVAFDKLKLTNCSAPLQQHQEQQIALNSMHRYQPIVCICPIDSSNGGRLPTPGNTFSFSFVETQFITVTAYQNQEITRLKIASNPFAKGFRKSKRLSRDSSPPDGSVKMPRPEMGVEKVYNSFVATDPVLGTIQYPFACQSYLGFADSFVISMMMPSTSLTTQPQSFF